MVAFSPVIEPNLPGAFITKHPRDEKTEKSFKIPFLTGVTYDEGLMKSLRKNIYKYSAIYLSYTQIFYKYNLFFV